MSWSRKSEKGKKTTLSTDTTDIRDEDELYAKLPLGAASLSGQLKTSGTLHVQTTVSGHMRLVSGPTTDATNVFGFMDATKGGTHKRTSPVPVSPLLALDAEAELPLPPDEEVATVPTNEITPAVVSSLGKVMVTLSPTDTSDCSSASRAMRYVNHCRGERIRR